MHKILVVDDEDDICDFVRTFFKDRGLQVFTALNSEEALSITKREKPDLILLDIKKKGMDGLATLKHIRELDKTIKVIMVTALEEQDKINEAYRLGAVDYVTKPLALDYLEETVERNLKITK
jgi:DNA-binding response OmpR family regulator